MLNLGIYNKELWAYTSMFKQLSAKYNDTLLQDYGKQLDESCEEVVNIQSIEEVEEVLSKLNMLILNLTILMSRKEYKDIQPICSYMRDIVTKVQKETGLKD